MNTLKTVSPSLSLFGFGLSGALYQALGGFQPHLRQSFLLTPTPTPTAPRPPVWLSLSSFRLPWLPFPSPSSLSLLAGWPACLSACVIMNSLHGCNDPAVRWQGQA